MPATIEAPRSAAEAAHLLAREGKHVHVISEGEASCLRGSCYPAPVLVPQAVREQARLIRLSLAVQPIRL